MQKSSGWLFAMVFAAIAFILKAVGAARYVPRLPDDWVGIGMYILLITTPDLKVF